MDQQTSVLQVYKTMLSLTQKLFNESSTAEGYFDVPSFELPTIVEPAMGKDLTPREEAARWTYFTNFMSLTRATFKGKLVRT